MYPQALRDSLISFGYAPTGNLDWDREVLHRLKLDANPNPWVTLGKVVLKAEKELFKVDRDSYDLSDENVYKAHVHQFLYIANNIVLRPQRRTFDIDDNNKDVLRFLLYYFNGCPLAEEVFPGRGYKLHKNILLQGPAGVGKTMMMQIFAEYLRRNGNPRQFLNISVTEMVNYYTVFNNIDRYTYNVKDSKSFQGSPVNFCLNDIGVENRPFYGVDTNTIVSDFLHARNEIWTNFSDFDRKFAHLTTNLTIEQLKKKFSLKDEYGRIIDRFKTYNVIPVTGKSRR
ncbi:MAG: AAA family ATPase [Muribaculaceae bacterium]|nr:AAA family ATPase [Muribaculaceae bacterium]